jgi:uncharacterized membrane protein YidH (DUF202 family)
VPIALGAWIALMAHHRWARNQRALRAGEPLPADAPRFLPLTIAVLAIVIAAIVVLDA